MNEAFLAVLKILIQQFQTFLEQQATIHKLPPPTPLPEDNWDALLKAGSKVEE